PPADAEMRAAVMASTVPRPPWTPRAVAAALGAAALVIAVTAGLMRGDPPGGIGAPAQASVPPAAQVATATDTATRSWQPPRLSDPSQNPNQAAPKVSSGVAAILVLPFTVTTPGE